MWQRKATSNGVIAAVCKYRAKLNKHMEEIGMEEIGTLQDPTKGHPKQ